MSRGARGRGEPARKWGGHSTTRGLPRPSEGNRFRVGRRPCRREVQTPGLHDSSRVRAFEGTASFAQRQTRSQKAAESELTSARNQSRQASSSLGVGEKNQRCLGGVVRAELSLSPRSFFPRSRRTFLAGC